MSVCPSRRFGVAILALCLALSGPAAGDTEAVPVHVHAYDLVQQGDPGAALALLREHESSGDPDVLAALGWLHHRGHGVATDLATAARYYRRAAEGGHVAASVDYGAMLIEGRGLPRDPATGLAWLRAAADAGSARAHARLAVLYWDGQVVASDLAASMRHFETALALGEAAVGRFLGHLLIFADERYGRADLHDCGRGERLLREALARGEADAALDLGKAYMSGAACERSRPRAVSLLKIAANARIEGAARELGIAFALLESDGRNRDSAIHWLALAVHRGEGDARPWLDWAIAGLDPPLGAEDLAEIRGLQLLLDSGAYALPEGTPERPAADD